MNTTSRDHIAHAHRKRAGFWGARTACGYCDSDVAAGKPFDIVVADRARRDSVKVAVVVVANADVAIVHLLQMLQALQQVVGLVRSGRYNGK